MLGSVISGPFFIQTLIDLNDIIKTLRWCGNESTKWLGQCPACKEWNTFVEERVSGSNASSRRYGMVLLKIFDSNKY